MSIEKWTNKSILERINNIFKKQDYSNKNEKDTLLIIRTFSEKELLFHLNSKNGYFKDYIKNIGDYYSYNNPHLELNYIRTLQVNKLQRRKIYLVEYMNITDPNYTIITAICERLSQLGYSVKRKNEFIICKKTGKFIIKKKIWEHLKKLQFPIIDEWKDTEQDIKTIKYININRVKHYPEMLQAYQNYFKDEGCNIQRIKEILGVYVENIN